MFKIFSTKFIQKNGKIHHDNTIHHTEDLEAYRRALMQPKYRHINFIYEIIPDDNGEDTQN